MREPTTLAISDDHDHDHQQQLEALLRRHRAAHTGQLERDAPFSWTRALIGVFSYILLLSDVLRTGAAITRYPYPRFESNQVMFFGPYAYPVEHLRSNETAGAQDIWAYKYDSTSIAMRAVAEHLSIAQWPSCVLYKSKCATRSIALSTIFEMLESLVARVAAHKSTRLPINLTLRTRSAWIDRIHHFILPWFFPSYMTRTNQAVYFSHELLSVPDFQFCYSPQHRVRPYACLDLWTHYAPICDESNHLCADVGHVFHHALGRLRSLQQRYAGMTLDLVLLESHDDNSRPAVSFQGRKFFDIVFITRVRDCRSNPCVTVAIDDYRYEGASLTSNVVDWVAIVTTLRYTGQLYAWVRLAMLFIGCYFARASEPLFAHASVFKKLVAGVRTAFLVPSQVVTYGSMFPIVCYVVAHALDSATVYELVAHKFNSPLGVFKLNPREFVQLSAVSMRSVWVLASVLHLLLYMRMRHDRAVLHGIQGIPEFLITFISCLTIMAQFRSIYFRDSRVLLIHEVVPSAHMASLHASGYDSSFSFWGLILTGNTLDVKCLTGSTAIHLALILVVWSALRVLGKCQRSQRGFKLVLPKSRVSYAAGTLWSPNALVVSWSGLAVPRRGSVSAVPAPVLTPVTPLRPFLADNAAESAGPERRALARRHTHAQARRSTTLAAKVLFTSKRFSLSKIAPETVEAIAARRAASARARRRLDFMMLDERSRETESMVYLMNLAVLTDPIALASVWWVREQRVGVYESKTTRRIFLLPHQVAASHQDVPISWIDYPLIVHISTRDLSWWDLLQCG